MTTEQSTTGKASEQLRAVPAEAAEKARQAAEAAQEKALSAGDTARRNPAPVTAVLLTLAGAIAAAVYFTRRRATKVTRRQKLAAMLHR